ncbi:MAG: hypothetical protein K8F59_10420 [Rhodobacteraceae bacterium]|nr:hypothetical protein [Paracoccaceae bacterium]
MHWLLALARLTVTDPQSAAAYLLSRLPDRRILLQIAVLVSLLGVLAEAVLVAVVSQGEGTAVLAGSPILLAVILFMMLMLSSLLVYIVGGMFGGTGSFDSALLLSVWLQFLMVLVQVVTIPFAAIVGGIPELMTFGIYLFLTWALINFIAVLHGFTSLWKVFAGFIATSLAASLVILLVLGMIGLSLEGGVPNV